MLAKRKACVWFRPTSSTYSQQMAGTMKQHCHFRWVSASSQSLGDHFVYFICLHWKMGSWSSGRKLDCCPVRGLDYWVKSMLNSFLVDNDFLTWPLMIIWQHRIGSILAQVMTCCLMIPSHYMNQCDFPSVELCGNHQQQWLKSNWQWTTADAAVLPLWKKKSYRVQGFGMIT